MNNAGLNDVIANLSILSTRPI